MEGPIKIFAGSAGKELATEICEFLDLPVGKSETLQFKNENLMVTIQENVREADVFVIQPSCTPVNDGIVELLIMIDALKGSSARRITAVLPYFPYCRSDKKDRPRISITARLMADLIQTAGANRVLTMDLHSPQIQGFFNIPVDQLMAAPLICRHYRDRDLKDYVLVAGDAGEAKELGKYANRLHLPMAIIDKRRYADDDRAVAKNLIGDVEGKHALIIDDEISTGGTMIEAAHFLKKMGAKSIWAAATHPVLAGNATQKFEDSPIEELLVTNTIPVHADKRTPKLKMVSVAPIFAKAIKRIHEGSSVSDLFTVAPPQKS
jgi:ribose-phosphate pyrophosphokinase